MKVYTLLDKVTDVPKSNAVYKNKSKFTSTLLGIVDTGVVYEEFDPNYNILTRLDNHIENNNLYRLFRFYPNGCFNRFTINKDKNLDVIFFDPNYAGYRGVYYADNSKIRYDFFAGIDQRQHTGKITGTLTFSGDTLYVKRDDRKGLNATDYSTEIYIKRKLPPEYFQYKANW
jgi:hypothetical protein